MGAKSIIDTLNRILQQHERSDKNKGRKVGNTAELVKAEIICSQVEVENEKVSYRIAIHKWRLEENTKIFYGNKYIIKIA